MERKVKEGASTLGWVAWIVIVFMFGVFLIGGGTLLYNKTFGVRQASVQRQVFKESKSYNEGMVQDLSRDKLELSQTVDAVARKAIIAHLVEKYSNFDEDRIENRDLRTFLIDIRNNNIQ